MKASKTTGTSLSKYKSVLWIGMGSLLLMATAAFLHFGGYLKKLTTGGEKQYYLRIAGSNTIGQHLMPSLVKAYLETKLKATNIKENDLGNGQVEISGEANINGSTEKILILINSKGSSYAFAQLESDSADIGMSSRRIEPRDIKDKNLFAQLSGSQGEKEIGRDALVLVVHPSNPIRKISTEQIARIFSGQSRNWSELGIGEGEIHPWALDEKSGTYQLFKEKVLQKHGVDLHTVVRRNYSNDSIADVVNTDPMAIGVISYGAAHKSNILSLDLGNRSVFPNLFNIGLEEYPLDRTLFLYINTKKGNKNVQEFIRFCQENAKHVVEDEGFLSLDLTSMTYDPSGKLKVGKENEKSLEYMRISNTSQRLSLDLQADAGGNLSGDYDAAARKVSNYLSSQKKLYHEVVLVALDYTGNDIVFSENAAKQAEELLKPYGIKARGVAFGPIIRDAYNDDTKGIRIEIWIN